MTRRLHTTSATLSVPCSRQTVWLRGFMLTALVAGAWAMSTGRAQARDDVYWSVGVHSPGAVFGVTNAPPPPVVVQPAYPYPLSPYPVYQRPIVVQPAPVIVQQPYPYGHGYVRPIVVAPQVYGPPGRGWGPRWNGRDDDGDRGGNGHRHGRWRHGEEGWHEHRRH